MNGLLSVVIFIPPSMDALSFLHYLEIQDSWWFPITLYIDCIYPVFQSYQSALHVHLLPFDSTYILTCMSFSLLMRCIWGKSFSLWAALRTVFLVHTLSLHPYYLHLSSFLNCVDRFNFRGMGRAKETTESERRTLGSWFWYWTQGIRLGGKLLYPQSHLTSPRLFLYPASRSSTHL